VVVLDRGQWVLVVSISEPEAAQPRRGETVMLSAGTPSAAVLGGQSRVGVRGRTNGPQRTKSPSPRPAEGRVRGFFVLAGRNLALAGSAPRGLSRLRAGSRGLAGSFKRQRGFRSVDGSMDALPLERELDDRAAA